MSASAPRADGAFERWPLPAELQATNAILAGIVTTASEPDAAMVLFKFLASPGAAAVIKATGMEPGGS
jgi:molybdate transport system substrate-binding protein